MKKLLLISLGLMFAVTQLYAQPRSQRKVLIEEFTNASCAPCAAANPAFNALINANLEKVSPVKYQVWWPGFDPMYNQNTVDVGIRTPYYNVSGVPHALMDGNALDEHPDNFTQAAIDAEYAISAPFTVEVSHIINAALDSIFITVTITATEAFTATGNLMGHCAITEDQIHFATAPGSNGETDFEWVMKKMYPDANGAALPATWTNGQVETLTYNVPLPSWIYNINQVAVVAWVQDNSDKNVKQSGKSAIIVQPGDANLDAGISNVTGLTVVACTSPISATAVLKNFGTTVITAANINYQVDNDVPVTTPWAGTLAAGATANIALANIPASDGGHVLRIWVSVPNGVNDFYPINNTIEKKFVVYATAVAAPITQGFEDPTFPPAGWFFNDVNNDNAGWAITPAAVGAYGLSVGSLWVNWYNIPNGKIDELYVPAVDLTNVTATSLTFDVAYAQYQAENDRLKVDVSIDCGTTWTNIYNKAGATLKTAPPISTAQFVPTASQWRGEFIALPTSTAGQAKVMVRFVAVSNYGNNMFLDNVNLTASGVGVNQITAMSNNIEVYPNPFTNQAIVDVDLVASSSVKMNVYNTLGVLVHNQDLGDLAAGNHKVSFDGSQLATGLYYFNFTVNGETIVKKVSVNR